MARMGKVGSSGRTLPKAFRRWSHVPAWLVGAVLLGFLAACQTAASSQAPEPLGSPDRTLENEPQDAASGTSGGDNEQVIPEERSFAGSVPAPEFPIGLDWLNTASPLSWADLRGKVVLLDFWTYGCINCMHIIPDLKRLEAEFPNELVVIGVHSAKFTNEGDTENIRQIILRYGLEHPVVNDRDFLVWQTWGARAWPTLVLVDPAGNVVGAHAGEGAYVVFQPVIEALVEEFGASGGLDRTPLEFRLEKEGLPSTVLAYPGKVLADGARQRIFIADTNHHRIVMANLLDGRVSAVFGSGAAGWIDGVGLEAAFHNPQGLALSEDGATLYVADTDNHAIRSIDLESGSVTTLVGTGAQSTQYPPLAGMAPEVALNSPWDLALDGDHLYIAMAGSHQIWRMNLANSEVEPFAGSGREGTADGARTQAELAQPSGLALDEWGRLYFADSESSTIRWAEIAGDDQQVKTLVGSGASLFDFGDVDGVGNEARLQHPLGVVSDGKRIYVADTYNSKIKVVDPQTQEITTYLGGEHGWRDGSDPLFYEPGGLDLIDRSLIIADTNNHAIRIVDLETGDTRTLVISGIEAFSVSLEAEGYLGSGIELPLTKLAAGEGTVSLDVQLPEGYKINTLAPSTFEWTVEGAAIDLSDDANLTLKGPQFPLEFSAELREGQGRLIGDFTIYYCEAEAESLCLIEQVRMIAPVTVGDRGESELRLEHTIEVPNIGEPAFGGGGEG